jgi:biofilm PGA synthesis N-glycosyltransferase PgaC
MVMNRTNRNWMQRVDMAAPNSELLDTECQPALRHVPVEFIGALFVLMFLFGVCLTILIPAGFLTRALSELSRTQHLIAPIWFVLLAGITFVVLLRWCTFQMMAFISQCKVWRSGIRQPVAWPLVSILVPAYQESDNIASTLRSLLELDYPCYEIIVIDDGSSDDTFAKAYTFVGDHGRCSVQVSRKPNGGKWSALNFAFSRSRGELILCIDADSRLNATALKYLVSRMDGPGIAGVAGQITVGNRQNIITRLQAYEYIIVNGGLRTAQSLLGSVLVVPGPIGLYRRTVLQDVWKNSTQLERPLSPGDVEGPFSHETFAEDFHLSLTVLALGGRILYEPRALSHTRSPNFIHSLISQRYRWFRGSMQVLRIYNQRMRRTATTKRRQLNLLIAATYLLDLFVLPCLNPILTIAFLLTIFTGVPATELFLWVSAVLLLNALTGTYHIVAQRDDLSLLQVAPFYDLGYGVLLNIAWAMALLDEIRRSKMHW